MAKCLYATEEGYSVEAREYLMKEKEYCKRRKVGIPPHLSKH